MIGQALVAAYRGDRARATELGLDLARRLADDPLPTALYGGFCGLAWAVHHLRAHRLADLDDAAELLDQIDLELGAWLVARGPDEDFDLIHGFVGHGVYALERGNATLVARVVGALADNRAWRTTRDLGLAHGLPGVIAMLARATRVVDATSMLRSAIATMLEALGPDPTRAFRDDPRPARLAWCYGDPGVALAFTSAAEVLGDAALRDRARQLAIAAARRNVATSGVHDASLCHGAAGLAIVFASLARRLAEPEVAAASERWRAAIGQYDSPDEPSLLEGAAGVELALLVAPGEIPPWATLFLASCV